MSFWTKLLIPVLVLALAGIADAKSKGGASKSKGNSNSSSNSNEIRGTVSSASDGQLILMSGGKKGSPLTITTDNNTKVSIDGQSGKTLADLQAGYYATVTQQDGVAKMVKATTSGAGGKGKPGSKKKT